MPPAYVYDKDGAGDDDDDDDDEEEEEEEEEEEGRKEGKRNYYKTTTEFSYFLEFAAEPLAWSFGIAAKEFFFDQTNLELT